MQTTCLSIALAGVLASAAAQAAVDNRAEARFFGYIDRMGEEHYSDGKNIAVSADADSAAAAVDSASDPRAGDVGIGARAASRVQGNGFEAGNALSWQGGQAARFNAGSSAQASRHDHYDSPVAGRVRFNIDYELYAAGSGARAYLSFKSEVLRLDAAAAGGVSADYAFLEKSLESASTGPAVEKGFWQSDWLEFSEAAALQKLFPTWASFDDSFAVGASSYTGGDGSGGYHPAGSSGAHAKATFWYEIAPVPEPASYALLLAGLGPAAWAARRRRG